jgi:hypothetical protein
MPAEQMPDPEFKPQFHKNKEEKKKKRLHFDVRISSFLTVLPQQASFFISGLAASHLGLSLTSKE